MWWWILGVVVAVIVAAFVVARARSVRGLRERDRRRHSAEDRAVVTEAHERRLRARRYGEASPGDHPFLRE